MTGQSPGPRRWILADLTQEDETLDRRGEAVRARGTAVPTDTALRADRDGDRRPGQAMARSDFARPSGRTGVRTDDLAPAIGRLNLALHQVCGAEEAGDERVGRGGCRPRGPGRLRTTLPRSITARRSASESASFAFWVRTRVVISVSAWIRRISSRNSSRTRLSSRAKRFVEDQELGPDRQGTRQLPPADAGGS